MSPAEHVSVSPTTAAPLMVGRVFTSGLRPLTTTGSLFRGGAAVDILGLHAAFEFCASIRGHDLMGSAGATSVDFSRSHL